MFKLVTRHLDNWKLKRRNLQRQRGYNYVMDQISKCDNPLDELERIVRFADAEIAAGWADEFEEGVQLFVREFVGSNPHLRYSNQCLEF